MNSLYSDWEKTWLIVINDLYFLLNFDQHISTYASFFFKQNTNIMCKYVSVFI